MAKKFFNQKVNNTKKTITQIVIISVCILGIIICFFIANRFNSKDKKDAVITIRDSVAVEVKTNYPEITTFFSELENVKESDIKVSYADADIDKVGEYPITIKIYNKTYNSKLNVIDSYAPELILKTVTIKAGDNYKAEDFVESCTDNSGEDCQINFYTLGIDQDGNKIDYESFTTQGTYQIQIIASDSSKNNTIKTTTLIIGNGSSTQPIICKYGDTNYDTNKYILATDVTENGCALDLNLYQNEKTLERVTALMEEETIKLKKEFNKLNISGNITLNRNTETILNTKGTGIVGYSLHIELRVEKDGQTEIIESYYVKSDGTRVYSINKYNLK